MLASRLAAEGAEVRAYDPVASGAHVEAVGAIVVSSPAEALDGRGCRRDRHGVERVPRGARPGDARQMARPLLIDGRNLLDPAEAAARASSTTPSAGRGARSTSEVAPA